MPLKTALYEIPVPSTDIHSGVRLEDTGDVVSLKFDYRVEGEPKQMTIEFHKVRAYRHRREVHNTAWHIEGAYDTLVEVNPSEWALEVRKDTSAGWKEHWSSHHYMIYLDSAGSFEFLAESWRVVVASDT